MCRRKVEVTEKNVRQKVRAIATKGFPIPQKLHSRPIVPSVFHQLLPKQDLQLNAIFLTRGNFSLTAILMVSTPYNKLYSKGNGKSCTTYTERKRRITAAYYGSIHEYVQFLGNDAHASTVVPRQFFNTAGYEATSIVAAAVHVLQWCCG